MKSIDNHKVDIFSYDNYRLFLKDVIDHFLEQGLSYRALVKKCGFTNPAYFQKLLSEERSLSYDACRKIAEGFSLNESECKYLRLLVRYEKSNDTEKSQILESLSNIVAQEKSVTKTDPRIHSSWLNGAIFCLANLKSFELTVPNIRKALRYAASEQEVAATLQLSESMGWLVRNNSGNLVAGNMSFGPLNDVRRIDLQKSHLRYLDMAKHRINDPLDEREYQGYTFAFSSSQLKQFKKKIRDFFDEIEQDVSNFGSRDCVMRLQTCFFKIANQIEED